MSADPPEKEAAAPCKRPSARDRICETARELFYKRGIRGVGVEMIAAEAGTTKMSLYRNFSSKDELVAECLCEQEREFWAWWDTTIEEHSGNPRRQLEALFDSLRKQASDANWSRGCQFANAAVELPDDAHPARTIILQHHSKVRERLRALCREMKARQPEVLADGLLLLMAGTYISCLVFKNTDIVESIDDTARAILDSHLGPPPE